MTDIIKVDRNHFLRAALEIGQSGENDTLPYDVDAAFIKEKADDLASMCITLFREIESGKVGRPSNFMGSLTIISERLLVPSGSHGFRITTKIHPFWNLYLNGLGAAIAEANECNRSERVHSYRLGNDAADFFDRARSWRSYKEATLQEPVLNEENTVVVQPTSRAFTSIFIITGLRTSSKT